jgi:hypothetical protein
MFTIGSASLFAQASSYEFDAMLFGPKLSSLTEEIQDTSRKQALYAYNVANLTVPGFKPILPPEDQKMLNNLAGQQGYSQEVLLEFIMSRMTENTKRYNAYLALFKSKVDLVRRVVSLGK